MGTKVVAKEGAILKKITSSMSAEANRRAGLVAAHEPGDESSADVEDLELRFSSQAVLPESPPKIFVDSERADVFLGEKHIGFVEFTVFNLLHAVNNGEFSVYELADETQDWSDLFDSIYDYDHNCLNKAASRAAGHHDYEYGCFYPAMLCSIDVLSIASAFRGKEYGLRVLQGIMVRRSVPFGLFVTKPYPLQFDHADGRFRNSGDTLGLKNFKASKQNATRKLRDYYRRAGFVPVRGTPYMLCGSDHVIGAF